MKASSENWSNSIKLGLAVLLFAAAAYSAEEVNSIVAKVGDQSITAVELDRYISPTLKSYYKMMPNDEEIRSAYRQERVDALKGIIDSKLLVREADRLEFSIPPIEIEKQLNKERERYASEEEFQAYLRENKITLSEFKEHLLNSIKAQAVLSEKVFKRVRVLPHEVHKFYTENRDLLYSRQPSVHVYQILIKGNDDPAKDPVARISDIRNQLARGANFQQLALMYSEGPMRDSGGDWGIIEQGHFGEEMAEVERAAFALEPGQYSDVIRTRFGYHIVYVSAKQTSHVQTEREAYDDVYRRVAESKSASVYEPYMNGLRRSCSIEIFDPELMDAKPSIRPGKKVGDLMSKPAPKKEEESAPAEVKEETPAAPPSEMVEVKEETVIVPAESASSETIEIKEENVEVKEENVETKEEAVPEKAEEPVFDTKVDPLKDLDAELDKKAADPDLPGATPVSDVPVFEMKEVK